MTTTLRICGGRAQTDGGRHCDPPRLDNVTNRHRAVWRGMVRFTTQDARACADDIQKWTKMPTNGGTKTNKYQIIYGSKPPCVNTTTANVVNECALTNFTAMMRMGEPPNVMLKLPARLDFERPTCTGIQLQPRLYDYIQQMQTGAVDSQPGDVQNDKTTKRQNDTNKSALEITKSDTTTDNPANPQEDRKQWYLYKSKDRRAWLRYG